MNIGESKSIAEFKIKKDGVGVLDLASIRC